MDSNCLYLDHRLDVRHRCSNSDCTMNRLKSGGVGTGLIVAGFLATVAGILLKVGW